MNVSEEERARNRAEHAARDVQQPAAQQAQGWSPAAKVLMVLIVGLFGYVAWAMASQGGFTRTATPEPATMSGLPSSLLGITVPGTSPFSADRASEAVAAAQDTARQLGLACTTSYELFGLDSELDALSAINAKMQADGYLRTNLMDEGEATSFKAEGPKNLFGLIHPSALYLCEY